MTNIVASDSTHIAWDSEQRVAAVRYVADASLVSKDADFLVESLTRWIGADAKPFAVLADGAGLRGTNAEYRAGASQFFRQHRGNAYIALINLGPAIYVLVELFRLGTGIQLKSFETEAMARAWLRTKAIAA